MRGLRDCQEAHSSAKTCLDLPGTGNRQNLTLYIMVQVCTFENGEAEVACRMCLEVRVEDRAEEGRAESAASTGSLLQPRVQSRDMERSVTGHSVIASTICSLDFGS